MEKIIVTGGAGFIGSALVRMIIESTDYEVVNIDKLTYAGNLTSLDCARFDPRYSFYEVDICDGIEVSKILSRTQPDKIIHLAAESHVDRSIDSPSDFIKTNVFGTYSLLEAARHYWLKLEGKKRSGFRFHHVSTDEVFGDLEASDDCFKESTPHRPSSPYSASKASSDHLVRAWGKTYGLPTLITNCSNNFGPYHFPEKFIPHIIISAITGKRLPIYGNGLQVRDWLFVDDHARALLKVVKHGRVGETYNVGGGNEKTNLEVVTAVCRLMEELAPNKPAHVDRYDDLIMFVEDRPGHDLRYAIDSSKIQEELKWQCEETFESGLRETVQWYLANQDWWNNIMSGDYKLERRGL